jgi:2-aminobenzoate-CoA ligase
MDQDGGYWFRQRADELIVSAGYNISPAEVERTLMRHPAILEAGVVGVPDPVRHRVAAAAIVVRPEDARDPDIITTLHSYVQTELAVFKCPRHYRIVDSLPRTGDHAVDRVALQRQLVT